MNGKWTLLTLLAMTMVMIPALAHGADTELRSPPFGYQDKNSDGINDLFRDADGDGTDDVTGKKYRHAFQFRDNDNDGKNDLFRDANGDGMNDLVVPGSKAGRRGLVFFLDVDANGQNDVTGAPVRSRGFGMHSGQAQWDDFVDEDGDGIDDRRGWGNRWRMRHQKNRLHNTNDDQKNKGKDNDSDDSGSDNKGGGKGKNNGRGHRVR